MEKESIIKKISVIILIAILTLSATLIVLPVNAQATIDATAYINAVPNPVQVNKPTLFHVGSVYPTPSQVGGWTGLSVEITKPDGSTETISSINTDTTGGTGVVYTPTMVGTYVIQTVFPETVTTANGYYGPAGTILQESTSEALDLVVTEDAQPFYPGFSLPQEYWTRPIDQQIREWYVIASNWLGYVPPTNSDPPSTLQPYNEYSPDSAHVLWAKPLTMGGIAGGNMIEQGFEQGDAYVGKFGGGGLFGAAGPVIIGGVLFYNQFESNGGSAVDQWVNAVDIHTGETLWSKPLITPDGDVLRLSFGQVFYWDSYNYHGVFDFLIATQSAGFFGPTNWHGFDPFSGRWVWTFEDMPSGQKVYGPKGEIFLYNLNRGAGTFTLWNSSRMISNMGSYNPQGVVRNASRGIEWTIDVPGLSDLQGNPYKYRSGVILGSNFARGGVAPDPASMWAVTVDIDNAVAEVAWSRTWDIPSGVRLISVEDVNEAEDLFIVSSKETRQTWGFRLSTGQQVWGPTPMRQYTDNWGHSSGNSWDMIADGKVIAGNYGGTVWCYNADDGTVAWTFDIDDPYTEVLHNNRWRFRPVYVTDGKVFIENTEHNPRDPQPRGAPFLVLDLETGEEIWRLPYRGSEWSSTAIIADSTVVMYNNYDQRIYAIGKGPSATTVQVVPTMKLDETTTITGTVMDVSPGTKDARIALRFPNGVPAVSDASMTDWMTYVYNQFTKPMATGVQVVIESIDPNGNYQNFGTATTDMNGNYAFVFTPEVPGLYMIMATFYGSGGYYGSTATSYVNVAEADEPVVIPPYPEYPGYQGPSSQDIANRVLADLPEDATPEEISNAVINAMPPYPEPADPEIPEYTTIDLVILVLVIIAIIIGIVSLLRKR